MSNTNTALAYMSAFEIISAEEFEKSTVPKGPLSPTLERGDIPVGNDGALGTVELTWCEWCKGYYIAEFHHGDQDDDDSSIS